MGPRSKIIKQYAYFQTVYQIYKKYLLRLKLIFFISRCMKHQGIGTSFWNVICSPGYSA